MTANEVQRRPGGRSARVRAAVMAATLDLLAEAGPSGFSIADVARRAGVHETSIYRRWGTRERLTLDAMAQLSSRLLPVPDAGSIRDDLIALGHSLLGYAETPLGCALMRTMASSTDDDAMAEVRARFWQLRYDECAAVVHRAVERGEIPRDVDPRLLLEVFTAPLHFRLLLTREAVDEGDLRLLADVAVKGVASD